MPFQSQAQRAYMFMHHPAIAKEWAAKYGGGGKNLPYHKGEVGGHGKAQLNMKPTGTPSNETWHPTTTKLPRIPGLKRDFGPLHPPSASRFVPKSRPFPNETEAMKQGAVEHLHGSEKHPQHKSIEKFKPAPLLRRDMSVAEKYKRGS